MESAPYPFLSAGMTLDYPSSRILPSDAWDTSIPPSGGRTSCGPARDGLHKVVNGLYQRYVMPTWPI